MNATGTVIALIAVGAYLLILIVAVVVAYFCPEGDS